MHARKVSISGTKNRTRGRVQFFLPLANFLSLSPSLSLSLVLCWLTNKTISYDSLSAHRTQEREIEKRTPAKSFVLFHASEIRLIEGERKWGFVRDWNDRISVSPLHRKRNFISCLENWAKTGPEFEKKSTKGVEHTQKSRNVIPVTSRVFLSGKEILFFSVVVCRRLFPAFFSFKF